MPAGAQVDALLGNAQPGGTVRLGVHVHEQRAEPAAGINRREIYGGRGLPAPPLLVDDRQGPQGGTFRLVRALRTAHGADTRSLGSAADSIGRCAWIHTTAPATLGGRCISTQICYRNRVGCAVNSTTVCRFSPAAMGSPPARGSNKFPDLMVRKPRATGRRRDYRLVTRLEQGNDTQQWLLFLYRP